MILMRFLQLFSTANAAADDEDVMRRGRGALRHTFTRLVTHVGNYSRCFATKLICYKTNLLQNCRHLLLLEMLWNSLVLPGKITKCFSIKIV